jgi:hypothetical protein
MPTDPPPPRDPAAAAPPPPAGAAAAAAAADVEDAPQSDGSKLKTFVNILRKFMGVSDLASVRFSLPSQLLEPRPNLEYWTYLDAPNAFVAIGTSDEPLDRMLEVVRFWLTKDLKYAKGKPCKPYNSCLGEFFRCNWETEDNAPRIDTAALAAAAGNTASLKLPKGAKNASAVSLTIPPSDAAPSSAPPSNAILVSYLTEQTSHHPPVSAFTVACPARGLTARGFDQITARFTGTSIKVLPGEHNLGIFITLERRGNETYQLTHPAAHLGGLLRGSLSISVSEVAYITCPQTRLKTILHYVEEGWLGRTTNKIDGVIFRYDPDNDDKMAVKDVPEADILCRLNGPWRERIVFTLGSKPVSSHPAEAHHTIIDIPPLAIAPKILPPAESQAPNESLTLWGEVTNAIQARQFGRATTIKQTLEERQRERARERERTGDAFVPLFFNQVTGNGGQPELTERGCEVLRRAQAGNWSLDGILDEKEGQAAELTQAAAAADGQTA